MFSTCLITGEESLPPDVATAARTRAAVAPQRYLTLVDVVAEVATHQRNEADQAYWNAVYEAVTE